MKESFEFEIAGKTYVSKKLTPILRAKLLKTLPFLKFQELDLKKNDLKITLDLMADTFENIPPLMWDFIKDEDKKNVGTYQIFLEELDKNIDSILSFIKWGIEKIQEINDFLAAKPAEETKR